MERLTPAECMQQALDKLNIKLDDKQANEVKNIFLALMDEHGYILHSVRNW